MPSLRSFDLNLLLLFDALFRERHLSAAAAAVGLSQPAASQALARLRAALGDELFERRGRRMEPTALAEAMAPSIRDGLRTLEQALTALTEFDASASTREFTLAFPDLGEDFFLARFMARTSASAPGLRLRSFSGIHAEAEAATARGEIHLRFDFAPPTQPTIRHRDLGTEEIVVIARKDHPRLTSRLTHADMLRERRVRVQLSEERWRRLNDILGIPQVENWASINVMVVVNNLTAVPGLVAGSDAVAFVPRSVAMLPPWRDCLQILAPPIALSPLPVFAHWHERYDSDPGHAWLRRFLIPRFWE